MNTKRVLNLQPCKLAPPFPLVPPKYLNLLMAMYENSRQQVRGDLDGLDHTRLVRINVVSIGLDAQRLDFLKRD